jgi:hypothetical protein
MASGQYHVFVEGPIDASPGADEALARAMQQRYGLPASDVLARLRKGRFRVKGNIDERTAGAYARDLARIGARVVVEELPDAGPARSSGALDLHGSTPSGGIPRATTPPGGVTAPPAELLPPTKTISPRRASAPPRETPQRTTTPPQRAATPPQIIERTRAGASKSPPQRTTTPPRGASSQPAISAPSPPQHRTTTPPRGAASTPATSTPAPQQSGPIRSGLAAAFDKPASSAPASLGALEQGADALSLAALDGSAHSDAPAGGTFEPPPQQQQPSPEDLKPPTVKFQPAKPSAPPPAVSGKPLDMFAPPPGDTEMPELALEDVARPVPTPAPTSPPLRKSEPSLPRIRPAGEPPALIARPVTPRWRFAAGVAIAIVLGFVPAHLVARWREHAADRSIDQRVGQLYEQATTDEALAALDGQLAPLKADKQSAHRNAALLAMLVWAAAGAGIGYAWFRRIPWRS